MNERGRGREDRHVRAVRRRPGGSTVAPLRRDRIRVQVPRFFAVSVLGVSLVAGAGCDSSVRQTITVRDRPAELEPFFVRAISPPAGRIELGPELAWRLTFPRELDRTTISSPLELRELGDGALVSGRSSLEAGSVPGEQVLVWRPNVDDIRADATYSLTIGDDIAAIDGAPVEPEPGAPELVFPLEYETFREIPRLRGTISAHATACDAISVVWETLSVDDNSPPAEIRYRIFVAPSDTPLPEDEAALLTPPGETFAFVSGLSAATSYRVAVAAVDAIGNSSPLSDSVEVTTPPENRCDPIPPSFDGLESAATDPTFPTRASLAWTEATDNETRSEDIRYDLFFALVSGGQDFDAPTLTVVGTDAAVVETLVPDTLYFVVVRAVDASDNSDTNTREVSVRTPASWSLSVRPIFDLAPPNGGGCSQRFCHSAETLSGGLDLASYRSLVITGGDTREPPTVVPGDSAGSYLMRRVDESNPDFDRARSRMPLGSPDPLPESAIATLRRWIDQGALEN